MKNKKSFYINSNLFAIFNMLLIFLFVVDVSAGIPEKELQKDYPYSIYCGHKYDGIVNNQLYNTLEKSLLEWKKYKKECDYDGIYEKGVAGIYLNFGMDQKAIEILQSSIVNADFNIIENASVLGSILLHVKYDYIEAENIATMLIRKYPDYWNGYTLMGQIYVYKEELSLAKQYLEKAKNIRLMHTFNNVYLSTVYYDDKRYKDAVNLYELAYSRDKSMILQQRPTATMILSLIELKRYDEAKKYFKEWEENDDSLGSCKWYETVKQRMKEVGIDK